MIRMTAGFEMSGAEIHFLLTGERVADFSRANPHCHAQCAAEWDAVRECRPFEVYPRGWAPLAPRPNAETDDDF